MLLLFVSGPDSGSGRISLSPFGRIHGLKTKYYDILEMDYKYIRKTVYDNKERYRIHFERNNVKYETTGTLSSLEKAIEWRDNKLKELAEKYGLKIGSPKFNILHEPLQKRYRIRYMVKGKNTNEDFSYSTSNESDALLRAETRRTELLELWKHK